MSKNELFFASVEAFDTFSQGLIGLFPDTCTDTYGNTCGVVISRANDITTSVDKYEIDEDEAMHQANYAAKQLNCRRGISEPCGPAIGSCGRFAVSLCVTDTRP